jgi:hypothetical protein
MREHPYLKLNEESKDKIREADTDLLREVEATLDDGRLLTEKQKVVLNEILNELDRRKGQ